HRLLGGRPLPRERDLRDRAPPRDLPRDRAVARLRALPPPPRHARPLRGARPRARRRPRRGGRRRAGRDGRRMTPLILALGILLAPAGDPDEVAERVGEAL